MPRAKADKKPASSKNKNAATNGYGDMVVSSSTNGNSAEDNDEAMQLEDAPKKTAAAKKPSARGKKAEVPPPSPRKSEPKKEAPVKKPASARGKKKDEPPAATADVEVVPPGRGRGKRAAAATAVKTEQVEDEIEAAEPPVEEVPKKGKGRAKATKAVEKSVPEVKKEPAAAKKASARGQKKKEVEPEPQPEPEPEPEPEPIVEETGKRATKRGRGKAAAPETPAEETPVTAQPKKAAAAASSKSKKGKAAAAEPEVTAAEVVPKAASRKRGKSAKDKSDEVTAEEGPIGDLEEDSGDAPKKKLKKVEEKKTTEADKKRGGRAKAKVVEDGEEVAVGATKSDDSMPVGGGVQHQQRQWDDERSVYDEDSDSSERGFCGNLKSFVLSCFSAKKKTSASAAANPTATLYNKEDFELPDGMDTTRSSVDCEGRFNLKISSWNVAGLRSWLKKDGLKFLDYEEPDIFCLQETKCTTDQLPEEAARINGYHPYWLCMPGGYAGVAIYSKIMPINVEYGIGHKDFDDVGRIITAEYEKFFLVNVYVPNSGRKLVNLEARMRWEQLFQQFVQKLDARKPLIICGDMNVSHQEIDLANPKANTRNAGFTREERTKMSELLALGFVDSFRHLHPTRKGAYTFWTYMGNARSRNVGWRLDYFLVSERLVKRVVENCMRTQCLGSDHCPITLFLKV